MEIQPFPVSLPPLKHISNQDSNKHPENKAGGNSPTYMWTPSNRCHLSRPSHQPQGQGESSPPLPSSCRSCQSRERMVLCLLGSSSPRRHQAPEWTAPFPLVSSSHHRHQALEWTALSPLVSSSHHRHQAPEWTALSPLVSSSHHRRLSLGQLGLPPPASSRRMEDLGP